jgi:NAD(P)-dependent dehydrogenase (short-subunit alcohol dehydrogenase family)
MAKEGATVVLSDLQEVEGTAVSKQIKENGGHCFFIKQDTTSEEGWQDICDSILENHGHLDILLNGAGVGSSAVEIEDMDFSTWRNCLSVNLDGVFLGCKYGIRAMRKGNGGSIINISSILGFAGLATATNYCASKGGVRLLTKAAALECARKTPLVRVNSIHPGFIDTPMVAGAIQRRGPEFRNYIEENVPLGELGEPNDIAEGVVYLASDGAKFVTGTELTIDGGFLAR